MISICISRAHGKKGHGATFLCPITKLQQHLSAILYVDNTDILHINLTKHESIGDVHVAIQDSVNSWGNLLIATRGILQPSKCFYLIISFEWTNGEWKYGNNLVRDELRMSVPLMGGGKAAISHKSVNHAEKTLGAMKSPDGNSAPSIQMIQEKAQQWINSLRNDHLHRLNDWFSLKMQFWPRIRHGLCSSMANLRKLDKALHCQYYQVLPIRGIFYTTMAESGTIDAGFME